MKSYRIKDLQKICHKISVSKGFWGNICSCKKPYIYYCAPNGEYCGKCNKGIKKEDRNNAEMLALMHSELSEALEDLRHGREKHVGSELADCVIRIMDYSEARSIDLEKEILKKIKKNKKRKFKHGKKF